MDKKFVTSIECAVAFEQCNKNNCPYFEMEQDQLNIFDPFGRVLSSYHPHCKNMFICQNAVNVAFGEKQE